MTIVEVDIVISASHASHSRTHWTVANLSYRWFSFVGRRLVLSFEPQRCYLVSQTRDFPGNGIAVAREKSVSIGAMAVLFRRRKTRFREGSRGGREEREQCVRFEFGPFQCDVRLLILELASAVSTQLYFCGHTCRISCSFLLFMRKKGRECNVNAGNISLGSDIRDALLIFANAPE